jgi:hypothetical protein
MATQALAEGSDRFVVEQANFLKKAFVEVLRIVFSDPSIAEEYRYDSVRSKRQLHIFRAFPKRITGLPAIIVETDIADVSIKQLGEEIVEQILSDDRKTVLARVYGGVVWIPVKITVLAKTTTDRELITDLASSYIRFAARPLFAKHRVEYLDIQSGEAGDEPLNEKDRMFIGTITIRCQTEFRSLIDMGIYAKIQKISIENITYSSAEGDEKQPLGE